MDIRVCTRFAEWAYNSSVPIRGIELGGCLTIAGLQVGDLLTETAKFLLFG
jgi:hypothetical protein